MTPLRRAAFAASVFLGSATLAAAQGLVYVDAKDGYYPDNNLYNTSGGSLTSLIEPGDNSTVNSDGRFEGDGTWHWANFGSAWGDASAAASVCFTECTNVYESLEEDAPVLGMRLGLEPGPGYQLTSGVSYDVYVAYWGDVSGNWAVQAGFDGTNFTLFDSDGADGAVQGMLASSAAWDIRPLDNRTDGNPADDPFYPPSDDNDNPFLDVTPGSPADSARTLRIGLVGQATANASGQIDVFLDDLESTDGGARTFFDGLAFVPTGTQVFTSGAIDRATGGLTISNPTSVDFQIESVSIRSASGSLDANQWNTITDDNVITDPDDDWVVTSPVESSVVELAEGDAGDMNGVTWLGGGTTLDLGTVWRRGIFEDVVIDLNLVGGGAVQITPEFSGVGVDAGDFDADGDIDSDDYLRLVQGLHADHATTSLAYSLGDINGSGVVDRDDVLAFAETFDVFNGSGAFGEMLESLSVPEPGAASLVLLALCGAAPRGRRRSRPQTPTSRTSLDNMKPTPMKLRAPLIPLVAVLVTACSARAVPVVDWLVDPLVPNSGMNLNDAETSSPSVGIENSNGTKAPNSADQTAIWGSIPIDVSLVNGEEVSLTGSIRLHNDDDSGASFNVGGFRWGIYQDNTPDEGNATGSWLGYLASSSSGGGTGDGRLDAKNPDAGDWETATPISTVSSATELGGDGRMFNLATGGTTEGYFDGTYEFGITIGRYGDEVTVSSFFNLTHPEGDYNNDGSVDAADYSVWRDNQGTSFELPNRDMAITGDVGQADYDVWAANYGASYNHRLGGGTDTNAIPNPRFPVATDPETGDPLEVTPHLTFEYNRVAFLLADHLNADFAQFDSIEIAAQNIESVTLEVDTTTGEATFKNVSSTDFSMTYYEITSPSGALLEGNWDSLAPDATIDGIDWDRAAGSDEFVLSEINLLGDPEEFLAGGLTTSLGQIWDTAGEQDLTLFFIDDQGDLIRGIVQYVGAAGLAVPEPGAALLAAIGAALLGVRSNRGSGGTQS